MPNLNTVELKAFVPSKDFERSKRFYQALGFTQAWSDDNLAYFHHGNVSFLLQNFYVEALAHNLMMHLLVEDVDAWHKKVTASDLSQTFDVRVSQLKDQPWNMRDFTVHDPSGVLWYIAQNTD